MFYDVWFTSVTWIAVFTLLSLFSYLRFVVQFIIISFVLFHLFHCPYDFQVMIGIRLCCSPGSLSIWFTWPLLFTWLTTYLWFTWFTWSTLPLLFTCFTVRMVHMVHLLLTWFSYCPYSSHGSHGTHGSHDSHGIHGSHGSHGSHGTHGLCCSLLFSL